MNQSLNAEARLVCLLFKMTQNIILIILCKETSAFYVITNSTWLEIKNHKSYIDTGYLSEIVWLFLCWGREDPTRIFCNCWSKYPGGRLSVETLLSVFFSLILALLLRLLLRKGGAQPLMLTVLDLVRHYFSPTTDWEAASLPPSSSWIVLFRLEDRTVDTGVLQVWHEMFEFIWYQTQILNCNNCCRGTR